MKKIKFSKLNGQGNDFILVDSLKDEVIFTGEEIKKICSRHFGVGADGVIIVRQSSKADLFMDYFNSDGTNAEMCGNGIRCMAKFAYDNNLISENKFVIETRAGLKTINMDISKTDYSVMEIEVNMGVPIFNAEKIPVNNDFLSNNPDFTITQDIAPFKTGLHPLLDEIKSENPVFNYSLAVDKNIFTVNCVSMGNPHCVIFIDNDMDFKNIALNEIGPKIENHPFFPKKTNVEFVKVENKNEISMLVWERGCGETLACGTGACASAVAAILLDKADPLYTVIVNVKGGILRINWSGNKKESVFLKGSAELSFTGEFYF
jgi:diaminopimelate epimerase